MTVHHKPTVADQRNAALNERDLIIYTAGRAVLDQVLNEEAILNDKHYMVSISAAQCRKYKAAAARVDKLS